MFPLRKFSVKKSLIAQEGWGCVMSWYASISKPAQCALFDMLCQQKNFTEAADFRKSPLCGNG
jgi:hypothetical protein